MEIQDQCFEYLRSVNSIAQKIGEDIDGIKDNRKTCWDSLDITTKNKIIDDALIDCSLVQKYECSSDSVSIINIPDFLEILFNLKCFG